MCVLADSATGDLSRGPPSDASPRKRRRPFGSVSDSEYRGAQGALDTHHA
jgi:hypothetical protein